MTTHGGFWKNPFPRPPDCNTNYSLKRVLMFCVCFKQLWYREEVDGSRHLKIFYIWTSFIFWLYLSGFWWIIIHNNESNKYEKSWKFLYLETIYIFLIISLLHQFQSCLFPFLNVESRSSVRNKWFRLVLRDIYEKYCNDT